MTDPISRRAALSALTDGPGIVPVAPPILLNASPFFDRATSESARSSAQTANKKGSQNGGGE